MQKAVSGLSKERKGYGALGKIKKEIKNELQKERMTETKGGRTLSEKKGPKQGSGSRPAGKQGKGAGAGKVRLADLPEETLPYEKCLEAGPAALSDRELLAVILRTGVVGRNVLELADHVLKLAHETSYPGLHGLIHMSVHDLMKVEGVGKVKAVQLRCIGELSRRIASSSARRSLCFSHPETIAGYYMERLRHEEQEHLIVMMLDSKNHLMAEPVLSKGTANGAMITPREIFLEALRFHAVNIILIHNHPSGDPTPSGCDIELTRCVAASGKMLGIGVLDHIIIGDRRYVSFRERGIDFEAED